MFQYFSVHFEQVLTYYFEQNTVKKSKYQFTTQYSHQNQNDMQEMTAHSTYVCTHHLLIILLLYYYCIATIYYTYFERWNQNSRGVSTFSPNKFVPRRTNSLAVLVPEGVLGGKERHDSTPHAADMNSLTMARFFSSQLGWQHCHSLLLWLPIQLGLTRRKHVHSPQHPTHLLPHFSHSTKCTQARKHAHMHIHPLSG